MKTLTIEGPLDNWSDDPPWAELNPEIEYVIINNGASIQTGKNMFANGEHIHNIEGLENLNTAGVTDMSGMFYSCSALTSLDVTHFDTSSVENMDLMFMFCSGLTTLDVSHFDTHNVTSMNKTFRACWSLTEINVSNFDTSKVTNMFGLFGWDYGLTSLDVTHFDTRNVEDMSNMFYNCSGLTSLDISNFDTSNVKAIQSIFGSMTACKQYIIGPKFEFKPSTLASSDDSAFAMLPIPPSSGNYSGKWTSNLNDLTGEPRYTSAELRDVWNSSMAGTYVWGEKRADEIPDDSGQGWSYNQANRTLTIDGTLESWNTGFSWTPPWNSFADEIEHVIIEPGSSTITAQHMFEDMRNLEDIQGLSNLDTSQVTNMANMFTNCQKLKELDLSNFSTQQVTNMDSMFDGCSNIATLDLSKFNTKNSTNLRSMFRNMQNLKQITLGKDFEFKPTSLESDDAAVILPNPPKTNGYNGKWTSNTESPSGEPQYTPEELRDVWDSAVMSGTYIWASDGSQEDENENTNGNENSNSNQNENQASNRNSNESQNANQNETANENTEAANTNNNANSSGTIWNDNSNKTTQNSSNISGRSGTSSNSSSSDTGLGKMGDAVSRGGLVISIFGFASLIGALGITRLLRRK